jgi:hypothetical protein
VIKECTEERYDEMLGILPPALMLGKGFLVGEPFDHRTCSVTKVVRASYGAAFSHAFPATRLTLEITGCCAARPTRLRRALGRPSAIRSRGA